ncbi:hypothetical protein FPRO04_09455 [Fusarium proliferatum]|nr:hypothetical protein FPRO03_07724 [Fusarium proliferatum]KAG4273588.1 hypothetical protein FPRO04_09455 [Fusarium proliferatum]
MVKLGVVSLLGSLALPVVAFHDLEQMPESWCVTYLSTYLVPISAATSSPAESSLPGIEFSTSLDMSATLNPSSSLSLAPGVTSTVVTTEVETAPPSSTTGPSTLNEQTRALGGFIGSPSEICDNANVFSLVDGQLLEGNAPIYFNGEDYKVFGGQQGSVPSGAITRTFFRDGDILRFQSSRIIPNGEAGFCQTPSNGLVYITFSSQPAGCTPVQLSAIGSSEIGTRTEEASTTAEATTSAMEETTTETSTLETTINVTTRTTSQETTTEITTSEESTTETTSETTAETTTEESTTENPTTTTFTSALDSTTEITTEAATTTTAASEDIVCPSNPQQCIRTFQIQCNTVIGGIPLSSGTCTLEQCSQACFNDPNCVIFTHSGTQSFSTTDSSNNQGSFALQGWVSGIRSTC